MQIAKEWSDGMTAAKNGEIRDFVAVGDVDIRVIGADNQLFDTEIPVRQILEQLIAKLSVPPFLLGLNWSTTERMSSQQADILTSELEYYRRLITPVIRKIASAYLMQIGLVAHWHGLPAFNVIAAVLPVADGFTEPGAAAPASSARSA